MDKSLDLFEEFCKYSITELHDLLRHAHNREEELFYHRLLTLKWGLAQEKVVGKELL